MEETEFAVEPLTLEGRVLKRVSDGEKVRALPIGDPVVFRAESVDVNVHRINESAPRNTNAYTFGGIDDSEAYTFAVQYYNALL